MNGKWLWIYAGLGLFLAATSQAGTRGGLYDMNAMINERHPFTTPGRTSLPAAVPAFPEMAPIAPPSPTLRYTPPPRPVAKAGANPVRGPYRPFGNGVDSNWFQNFYISAGMGVNLPNDLDGTTGTGGTNTIEFDDYFVIAPNSVNMSLDRKMFINESNGSKGKYCEDGFSYNSKTNEKFLSVDELRELLENQIL